MATDSVPSADAHADDSTFTRAVELYFRPLRRLLSSRPDVRSEINSLQQAVEALRAEVASLAVQMIHLPRLSADISVLTTDVHALLAARSSAEDTLPAALKEIAGLLRRIDDPWVKHLAEHILLRNTTQMLDGLVRPTATYRGEFELYRALTERVSELEAGQTLFAVCGAKTWDAPPVRDYFAANERAVERRVHITRIFYGVDDRAGLEAAKRQAELGINARVLRPSQLDALNPDYRIPPDLGVAIFGGEKVIVHSGLGQTAYACRFDCTHLASLIRSQFEVVERLSEPAATGVENRSSSRAGVQDINSRRH